MRENDWAKTIVDVAFPIPTKLGPELLESVQEAVMAHELRKCGLQIETQVPIPVEWDSVKLEAGFRADILVERCVLGELPSIEQVAPVYKDNS